MLLEIRLYVRKKSDHTRASALRPDRANGFARGQALTIHIHQNGSRCCRFERTAQHRFVLDPITLCPRLLGRSSNARCKDQVGKQLQDSDSYLPSIPCRYDGVYGVPFLTHHFVCNGECPEQRIMVNASLTLFRRAIRIIHPRLQANTVGDDERSPAMGLGSRSG